MRGSAAADDEHQNQDQGEGGGEGSGHQVLERAASARQHAQQQRDESGEQNGKAAEEKQGALCFARHEFIVTGAVENRTGKLRFESAARLDNDR